MKKKKLLGHQSNFYQFILFASTVYSLYSSTAE